MILFSVTHASCRPKGSPPLPPTPDPDTIPEAGPVGLAPDTAGMTIRSRFPVPEGFVRADPPEHSFGAYLQQLPLRPHGARVYYHDGRAKPNAGTAAAVVDLDTGPRDLQQCADAVIRLRAEYLFAQGRFEEILFHFTNGFPAEYRRWRRGERIRVDGRVVSWYDAGRPSATYASFRQYLNMVFAYAGSISLRQELNPFPSAGLQIGDVFIQSGSPGHAVIVADMALHPETGEKIFLLAQSYMPAQDIHVLSNPNDAERSPWYPASFGNLLFTPEWTFRAEHLRRFPGE